jgi:hypothetical protein
MIDLNNTFIDAHFYNYKCFQCGNIFCKEHFELHAQQYKGKSLREIGSRITELDDDFKTECIVCESIREIRKKHDGVE